MKITILTQYFPPEVGAPQNRLFELAVRLQKQGIKVTVITGMPNYPQMRIHEAYRGKWKKVETIENIKVIRCWLYATPSKGIFNRLLNYFSFVFTSFWIGLFSIPKQDYLMVESPPLFLGKTGFLLSRLKRAKLIFNVSDLWPESAEKLGIIKNRFILKVTTLLEEFLYRKSELITGQTQGICTNIQNRFPKKQVYWLPNGVDIEFYQSGKKYNDKRLELGLQKADFVCMYAGIIGHAQGLETILQAAHQLQEYPKIKFVILGSGPEKEKLLILKESMQLSNVVFHDAVTKDQMPAYVQSSDIAIIPLKKIELFQGAIPSKIFENLAMQKPILLGVEGEAKKLFIDDAAAGMAFEPENATELAQRVLSLFNSPDLIQTMGENGKRYVSEKFTRDIIAEKFYAKLLSLEQKNA